MSELQKLFLLKLALLIKQFDAEIIYTNDDDGLHINLEGEEVFVGLLDAEDAFKNLMKRINEC